MVFKLTSVHFTFFKIALGGVYTNAVSFVTASISFSLNLGYQLIYLSLTLYGK